MSDTKSIVCNEDLGSVNLLNNGRDERLFFVSKGLMKAFGEEIVNVSGRDTLAMAIKRVLESAGEGSEEQHPTWETFEKLNDDLVLPVDLEKSSIPEGVFIWDGKTRVLNILNIIDYDIFSVKYFQSLKDKMGEILTERGRDAILRNVGKRAGKVVGEMNMKLFNWVDMDTCMEGMDGAIAPFLPLVGWGKPRVITRKGKDGNYMIVFKIKNSFEANGISSQRPICVLQCSSYNGVGEIIGNKLANQSTEGKEVKCVSMGDEYCIYVLKYKPMGAQPLDWKELEEEWQALEKDAPIPE